MDIYYSIEWGPDKRGPNCRPMGVWAIGDECDLQCGFLRGYEERAAAAERIGRRLVAAGERLDPHVVLTEHALGIEATMNYCGPITHADDHTSLAVCVQSVLGVIDKLWDNKKMRWRSGLKMPLERYRIDGDEQK